MRESVTDIRYPICYDITEVRDVDRRFVELDDLRELRRRQNLSQEKMAENMSMTREAYNRLEVGRSDMLTDDITGLCRALDISCAELVSRYPMLFRPFDETRPVAARLKSGGVEYGLSSDEYAMAEMARQFTGAASWTPELTDAVMELVRLRRQYQKG